MALWPCLAPPLRMRTTPCGPAAALAMQTALRRYSDDVRRTQGLTLQTRVGLNSGEVLVRTISNDLHMDYSAVGQTVHLAAHGTARDTWHHLADRRHAASGRGPGAGPGAHAGQGTDQSRGG